MTDDSTTSPIFIVGSVHSGTTLLRRMIESDESIQSTPGETMLFAEDRLLAKVFGDLRNKEQREAFLKFAYCRIRLGGNRVKANINSSRECFEENSFSNEHIAELVKLTSNQSITKATLTTFDFVAAVQEKKRWLEKTPAHILNLKKILEIEPSAKVLELVRDPRDILASKRVRRNEDLSLGKSFSQGHEEKINYDPFVDSLAWRRVIHAGNKIRKNYPNNILRLSYEELVRETDGVARRVGDFLGLADAKVQTDVPWRNSTTVDSTDVSEGISDKAVGRGIRELSKTDIAICQLINHRQMTALGYEHAKTNYSVLAKAILAATMSFGELFNRIIRGIR